MELLLPNWYVESQTERMSLYRELDNIANEEALKAYEQRLIDRFGQLPEQAYDLLNMVRLRWIAQRYGVERLILKRGKMHAYLVTNEKSIFYTSPEFGRVLNYCMQNHRRCALSQRDEKRLFVYRYPSLNELQIFIARIIKYGAVSTAQYFIH